MAKYSIETLEKLTDGLGKLKPIREEFTTQQLIDKLRPKIREAMEKGYTIPKIVEWLNEQGVKVTASSFRSYLGEPRKTKGRKTGDEAGGK